MTEYWFKPRRFGYGVTPITWQGWLVTVATLIVVVGSAMMVPQFADKTRWAFIIVPIDLLAIVALLIVSRLKTDGEWRWRWGGR
jgi:hypothetical protein